MWGNFVPELAPAIWFNFSKWPPLSWSKSPNWWLGCSLELFGEFDFGTVTVPHVLLSEVQRTKPMKADEKYHYPTVAQIQTYHREWSRPHGFVFQGLSSGHHDCLLSTLRPLFNCNKSICLNWKSNLTNRILTFDFMMHVIKRAWCLTFNFPNQHCVGYPKLPEAGALWKA